MNTEDLLDEHDPSRRRVLQAAGATMLGGLAATDALAAPATPQAPHPTAARSRNTGPLGARLQGVQHFGVTVQNMDRAYAFYTDVLGGTEVMRDGDFQGDILNCERIIVGPYGHVRADVHVRVAIVAGMFDGGIQAEERIELLGGARVKGDLTYRSIVIDDGVRFSGRCTTLEDEATTDASSGVATRGGTPRSV